MSASPLPAPANEPAMHICALPSLANETGATTIIQFVRELAIRQARLDAAHVFKSANDNDQRTVH